MADEIITAYGIPICYMDDATLKRNFVIYMNSGDSVNYIEFGVWERQGGKMQLLDIINTDFKRKPTKGDKFQAEDIIENLKEKCKNKNWNLIQTNYMGLRMVADIIATHVENIYGNKFRFLLPLDYPEEEP